MGIDPGKDGAIAFTGSDEKIHIKDMPTLETQTKKTKKRYFDPIATSEMIKEICPTTAYIEKVHAMPKQGVSSMFNMGYGLGMLEGILSVIGVVTIRITSQEWKKNVLKGYPKGKGFSVKKAEELYPYLASQLKTKRGKTLDGRADAICILHYGMQKKF